MKKLICLVMVIAMVCAFAGCGSTASNENNTPTNSNSTSSPSSSNQSIEPKSGDEVSIVGQVASSTLVNGNTLWVQVKQDDGSFIVYHCQLKDDFIEKAENKKLASVAKVKGLFLSKSEFEQENTATLVTLYDCEIIE